MKLGEEMLLFNSFWEREDPLRINQIKVLGFVPHVSKPELLPGDDADFMTDERVLRCKPRQHRLQLVCSEGTRHIHDSVQDPTPISFSWSRSFAWDFDFTLGNMPQAEDVPMETSAYKEWVPLIKEEIRGYQTFALLDASLQALNHQFHQQTAWWAASPTRLPSSNGTMIHGYSWTPEIDLEGKNCE